ncbi:MAG: hypothetical protein ACREQL_03680 [Candidatus Binatia bacterium]
MTCRKAYELDLPAFLADPTGAVWAEFRDHYPRCPACAAEVRAWTELHLALGSTSHPDPADLVRYVDGSTGLPPTTRHAIAEHLAARAACRDEAHTLRTFDPLAPPAAVLARPRRRRFAFPSLGRIVWHPAFAYAVALVAVLYPTRTGRLSPPSVIQGREGAARPPASRQVSQDPRAASPAPESARSDKEADAPAERLKALGYLADDRAGARAKDTLDQKPKTLGERAPEILLAVGEPTIAIPPGAREVVLRVTDAPPDVTGFALVDGEHARRSTGSREAEPEGDASRPAFRVSASMVRPGTYVLTLLSAERPVGERRVRVAAP